MAKKCFYLTWVDCGGTPGSAFVCAEDLAYLPGGGCGGGYFSSVSNNYTAGTASEQSGSFVQVSMVNCPGCIPGYDPDPPCDCINGGCVPKTTYGTPGVFPNIAACEAGCAKNSNCTGECVDPAEIAAHRQALNTLQSKFCR